MARPKKHKNEVPIDVQDRTKTLVLKPENKMKHFPGKTGKKKSLKHQDVTVGDAEGVDAQKQAENARKDGEERSDTGSIIKTGERVETKMYQGDITAKSVSSETGEEISIRMHIPTPVTEEGVWYRFRKHHDSAMRDKFAIDVENKTDPMLRTKFGG